MKKINQRIMVLNWLKKNKTLTVREAMLELNINSLPKRIEELRRMGHNIKTTWRQTPNGSRYGVYELIEEVA